MIPAAVVHVPGEPPVAATAPPPEPGPGELLIAVTAAPITPLDRLCASGTSYFGPPEVPYVPGVQGVGVVERGTDRIPPGTPVWFATTAGMAPGHGSMRARACATEDDVVPLPAGVDPVLFAALGLSAVAAEVAMTWRGGLTPGEHVLVLGAGGVVGQSAVQLARFAGARRVVAAARSQAARERALRLGADAVAPLPDGPADVADVADALRAACGEPVDLVLDPVFGVAAAAALRVLRPGGRLVNLGSAAGETAPLDSATLRSKSLHVRGYTNNELTVPLRAGAVRKIAELVAAGRLTAEHERAPLGAVTDAWTAPVRTVLVPG
ncbi:NADPH:quinone reductase [Pseudonocardia thermophila]|uniref:NADPH:quinone reductase n=1 Tax=Pseudonocardia thermophila TaxID=1848 RepID=A0A1M6NQF3_PSETH|nr:zinc-binding alcohol dehydrogenase family protein [Pseudonocardia thermophila]SHJ97967.1 NADPH:quinone reductase [Pseudonocardia thermophila]